MTDDLFNLLRQDMINGFSGIHQRLDVINGRVRETEQSTAILQDRDSRTGRSALWWGGSGGAAVIGLIEAVKAYFAKP